MKPMKRADDTIKASLEHEERNRSAYNQSRKTMAANRIKKEEPGEKAALQQRRKTQQLSDYMPAMVAKESRNKNLNILQNP